MTNIAHAAQRGNNSHEPSPDQIAIQQAVKRHGRVNGEGRDRLAQLAWLVNGGKR